MPGLRHGPAGNGMRTAIIDPEHAAWSWFSDPPVPFDGAEVVTNRWWITHPEKGLPVFRQHSPQCNSSEAIARRIAEMYPWAEVKFLPVAYIRREH